MGQISFEQATESMNSFSNDGPSVGFFSLKNDGDEAIVRFMHDNTASFDIVAVHPITVEGKFRKVSCLRNPKDPLENCPLCKSGAKIENRFFIHIVQYTKDDNGNIIPSAKVWDRSLFYANQLAAMINEYGPLSDCVFKIKRDGAAGSMDTKYQIMYANPQVYRADLYPKRPDLFDGYKTIGSIVMEKNFDEMSQFLATGKFPEKPKQNTQQNMNDYSQSQYNNMPNQQFQQPPQFIPPSNGFIEPQQNVAPWENAPQGNQRPVRTY